MAKRKVQSAGKQKPTRVRWIYHTPENYAPIYVNGVHGGISPRGGLICNFFLERLDTPDEEEAHLNKDGQIKAESVVVKEKIHHPANERVFRRDVKVGLVIPMHQVEAIANWMLQKFEESQKYEQSQNAEKEVETDDEDSK